MAETALLAPLGWLAAPLFKTLFDKAHHHLGTGIDEKMKILQATVLPRLSIAIEKAEKSPKKDKLVDWLKRLKGAYYEAEEAIDLFQYHLLKQKVKHDKKTLEQKEKNGRGTRICLRSQFVPRPLKIASVKLKHSLSIFSHQKIMLKVCINKLIEIAKESNEFRDLLEVQENARGSEADRETISEPPARVFGRDIDKENVVSLLTKKPLTFEPGPSTGPAIPVIAIIGRSGVGKTALAQYVYKRMDGHEHFDLCVWVHTKRKFKATGVIKNMIEIINSKERACNENSFTSLEALLTQIRSMLAYKKLLLVLDDFWSDIEDFVDQWENFICCLSSCLPGSRILLTTQSKNAAQQFGHASATEVETYNLQGIEEGQFSELFMHYSWPSNCDLPKEKFEIIGRQISVKLKGDPGAAKLVGSRLRGKLDLRYWEEVAQNDWLGDNMKARIWSYQQLSEDLQRCFGIFGLFPKGTTYKRQFLIDFWMAQGFIRPIDKQERLEDIGENYLHELASRFFIEQVEDDEEIYYELHDLFHDLAEWVLGDDFIRIDSTNSAEVSSHISHMLSRSENIRHIYLPSSMINEMKEKLCLMNNIYTFCVEPDGGIVPNKVLQEILKHIGKLRVLEFPECVDDFPDSIGDLKHLRLLYVHGSQSFKKLPDSICKLYHLQTLLMPNCESLPKDFSQLVSLRRFGTVKETMSHISHVGRLTSLQGLDQFVVRKKRGYELHQLENLNQLRDILFILGLENVENIEDAVKANMRNKKHLDILKFEWNSDERDTNNVTGHSAQHLQLLEALQPHPNISSLSLKGFGGYILPSWLLSQNSLKCLALMGCAKVEEISSIVESLPNCEILILWGLKNLKKMPSLPPNLTYLEIDHIPQLSYFSEDDFLTKEERKQSMVQVLMQTEGLMKLEYHPLLQYLHFTGKKFLQIVKERLEASPEICTTSSPYEKILETMKLDPYNNYYSPDELLDAWVICMHYHIENMFNKNQESKLVLPSSLTILKISSCSITSDALSNCIQCLVSLIKLTLSDIQTITSLPPKEALCSLKNLQYLTIKGCYLLCSLGGIGALSSLIELKLKGCLNLNRSNTPLPISLERLTFRYCLNCDAILAKSYLPVLYALEVRDILFKNWIGVLYVGHLTSLKELFIMGWNDDLAGLNLLTTVNSLKVGRCPEIKPLFFTGKYTSALGLVEVDNPLVLNSILSNETISSIYSLRICFFRGDSTDEKIFQSLTSLKHLCFSNCNITHLPKNLKNHALLNYMELVKCPNLCELEGLPRNLRELKIKDCPTLTEKFNKGGPYRVRFREGSTIVTFLTEEERNRF